MKSTSVTYLSTSQWNSQQNGKSIEFYNDLVANPSGTTFAGSWAGLSGLCWFGRKESCEGAHRCLWVPADLPSVATWGQELCEERDALLPPYTSSCWYHLTVEPAGKEGLIYCRRSDWTFSLFYHTLPLVFLKPSVLLPQNTTLSLTDCYNFIWQPVKFLKYPVTQICQKSQLCQIYSHISSSRQQRCNCCCFINDGVWGSVT